MLISTGQQLNDMRALNQLARERQADHLAYLQRKLDLQRQEASNIDLLIAKNRELADSERYVALSRRMSQSISGDFEGSVTASWKGLDGNGGGIVEYDNKEYVTDPIGFTSLPRGARVELSHANGVYYSKF